MSTARYALYYAPDRNAALWRVGSRILGYDAATGQETDFLKPPHLDDADWALCTREPRRYGFHATLKAPFELADGRTEAELAVALAFHASRLAPVTIPGLEVSIIGNFIALRPTVAPPELSALAMEIVASFDSFRAPLSASDRERRLKSPLTPSQIRNLDRWGYPYVGDDFRFHMTLTGPLHIDERDSVRRALDNDFRIHAPLGALILDRLCLYKQETRDARFRIMADVPLAGR